MYLRL